MAASSTNINDPKFMNAYMIIANAIKDVAKDKAVPLATGEAHAMSRRLLLDLKRAGYRFQKQEETKAA